MTSKSSITITIKMYTFKIKTEQHYYSPVALEVHPLHLLVTVPHRFYCRKKEKEKTNVIK